MANRYIDIQVLKTETGKRFYGTTKYPQIPLTENDLYVYTTEGDRFDILAQQYYGDSSLWWIISIANEELAQNSLTPPIGSQIRIPANVSLVLQEFNTLNNR